MEAIEAEVLGSLPDCVSMIFKINKQDIFVKKESIGGSIWPCDNVHIPLGSGWVLLMHSREAGITGFLALTHMAELNSVPGSQLQIL